jgi:hypothetical protein
MSARAAKSAGAAPASSTPTVSVVGSGITVLTGKKAESLSNSAADGWQQNAITQRYRNMAVADKAKAATSVPVLAEFTLEQNGQALTVVDRDGSVYNGFVQPAPADASETRLNYAAQDERATLSDAAKPALSAIPAYGKDGLAGINPAPSNTAQAIVGGAQVLSANEAQNYFFRVEGTNRTLNQRVVFTGNMIQNNYMTESQNAPAAAQTYRLQEANQFLAPAGRAQLQLQNNYINGQVLLNNSKAGTELNAIPVER